MDNEAPSGRRVYRWESVCWLLLFALIVYRAWSQSLTLDEARSWLLYVAGPWRNVFHWVDASNHFLFSLLARISVRALGASEFAMRLPSVVAAAVYLETVRRMTRWLFGGRALAALCGLLMAANPLVLDLLVAARGYSIMLAGLAVALYALARYESGDRRAGLLAVAAVALSLAAMANLTAAVPALAMSLLVLGRAPRRHWPAYFMPALALALLYLSVFTPLRHLSREYLYYGTNSLAESMETLGQGSVGQNAGLFGLNSFPSTHPDIARVLAWFVWPAACVSVPFLARRGGPVEAAGRLAAVLVLAAWALLAAGHASAGMLYPMDRTGVYFLPLYGLVLAILCAVTPRRMRLVPLVVAVCLAASYCVQLHWTYFAAWRFDADTRELVRAIPPEVAGKRLGVSWLMEPAVRFYLARGASERTEVFARGRMVAGLDAYLLTAGDAGLVRAWGLRVIRRGAVSGSLLAVPENRNSEPAMKMIPPGEFQLNGEPLQAGNRIARSRAACPVVFLPLPVQVVSGIINGMELRIDKAGRIVVPKPIRERLGFKPDAELVAIERPDGVLLKRVERRPSMVKIDGLWVHQGSAEPGANWKRALEDVREERVESILKA